MTKQEKQSAVLAEARAWLGTPYHHHAAIKGAGVDCAQILIQVYAAAGVIEAFDAGDYPFDWAFHRDEERYLGWLQKYAREVEAPQPGDIAVWKFGRCFSHAAIVVEWPMVIHSIVRDGVVYADATKAPLTGRDVKFFSVWGDE